MQSIVLIDAKRLSAYFTMQVAMDLQILDEYFGKSIEMQLYHSLILVNGTKITSLGCAFPHGRKQTSTDK